MALKETLAPPLGLTLLKEDFQLVWSRGRAEESLFCLRRTALPGREEVKEAIRAETERLRSSIHYFPAFPARRGQQGALDRFVGS
jgi:hypothetical protein